MSSSRRHFGSVRKLPSGRWQAGYWHANKRHTAPSTFVKKVDAVKWLVATQALILKGEWIDPTGSKTTVNGLGAEWLASNTRKREASRARDEAILRVHVYPQIGEKPIGSVTRADIQALVDTWAQGGSASTVIRQFATVRALFSWAMTNDMLGRSPCRGIRLPRLEQVHRPAPDPEALSLLAEALGTPGDLMMWLGAVAGLRWSEVAGLRVLDLDLLNERLSVQHQLSRAGTLEPPKSAAGRRTFALPDWLVEGLAGHLQRSRLTAADGEHLVFTSSSTTPLSYTNWRRRVWVPACNEVGLAGLKFHDLRSMAASALVAAGVDVKTAQTRLGHSSPQMTLAVYARMTEQADRKAAEAVGTFFDPSRTDRARRNLP